MSGEVSFSKLKAHVKKKILDENAKKLELSYHDEDGDLCVVSSTSEFLDAINQFCGNNGSLKLEVTYKTREPKKDKSGKKVAAATSANTSTNTDLVTENGIISDPSVTNRIFRAMRGSFDDPEATEECPDELALSHLLGNFQDHFNLDYTPAISVDARNASANADNFDPEVVLGPLIGLYTMKDGKQRRSKYIAMDDIYLDLTQTPSSNETVTVVMPILMLERLASRTQPGAPQPPDDFAPEDELDAIEVKFDSSNPPEFATMEEKLDSDGLPTGAVAVKSEGHLPDIMNSEEHRHFYKISGVFQVEKQQIPDEDRFTLAFSLVSLRVFSTQDHVLESLRQNDIDLDPTPSYNP